VIGGTYSTHGRDEKCIHGKSERKRPNCTWKDDIKINIVDKVGGFGLDSCGSVQVPVAGFVIMVMNLQFP
jgi:hypothetical protein